MNEPTVNTETTLCSEPLRGQNPFRTPIGKDDTMDLLQAGTDLALDGDGSL